MYLIWLTTKARIYNTRLKKRNKVLLLKFLSMRFLASLKPPLLLTSLYSIYTPPSKSAKEMSCFGMLRLWISVSLQYHHCNLYAWYIASDISSMKRRFLVERNLDITKEKICLHFNFCTNKNVSRLHLNMFIVL